MQLLNESRTRDGDYNTMVQHVRSIDEEHAQSASQILGCTWTSTEQGEGSCPLWVTLCAALAKAKARVLRCFKWLLHSHVFKFQRFEVSHCTRSVAAFWAAVRGMALTEICVAVSWTASCTLSRFYDSVNSRMTASQNLLGQGDCQRLNVCYHMVFIAYTSHI